MAGEKCRRGPEGLEGSDEDGVALLRRVKEAIVRGELLGLLRG